MASAWQRSRLVPETPASIALSAPEPREEPIPIGKLQTAAVAIATVNGHPIPRGRLVELLLLSRGADVLEQLIGMETAAMAAAERGLTITRADVDREYGRALLRLTGPLSSITPASAAREEAERLLETVLLERSISSEEFNLITRRNAYLRKIVDSGIQITRKQLQEEHRRLYGRRFQVRHIQLATLAEVERVKARLAAGEDFGELARVYSANVASARVGGLLGPFSAEDEAVPSLFRDTVFSLGPDEVSGAVRVGEWYHLIKVAKVFRAKERGFEQVRAELTRSLRERIAEPAMYKLFEKLFRQANIEIHDSALRFAFERKHRSGTR